MGALLRMSKQEGDTQYYSTPREAAHDDTLRIERAAKLLDELLFKKPEGSHLGDCPICCLPMPADPKQCALMSCCSKCICRGCCHANEMREAEGRLQQKCAFCRKVLPKTDEEINERLMKRVEANDPVAMCYIGTERCKKGDYKSAFAYWTKAAALGDVVAHYQLSCMYQFGHGVEKDEKKALHHAEEAAIAGHPEARYYLGWIEEERGRSDRAAKHYIIAPNLDMIRHWNVSRICLKLAM